MNARFNLLKKIKNSADPSQAWLKPLVTLLLERGTRPFHVADVDASAKNGSLRVAAWNRSGGLRLAPIIFAFGKIDNPVAAKVFAKELNRRKQAAAHSGNFPATLNCYWAKLGTGQPVSLYCADPVVPQTQARPASSFRKTKCV